MRKKAVPEILAPCGSYDILVAAVKAGADACYIGGDRFGARAYAANLNAASYKKAVEYAHLHNTRIYLTVNTLLKDNENEIGDLAAFLQPYYELGIDAVIVQDLGVFALVKRSFPDLKIHCSTQMNITSLKAAEYMKEQGADRIVTAREMSLEEIRNIKKNADIEVETFVHGAMCYSYSGQCLMSSFAGGRSGNRGRCAQPCRKCYDGAYPLSMKDMCSLELLPELLETGIDSLKIEGRMKNEYYVASAVDAYKELANDWADDCFSAGKAVKYKEKLANVFNRGGFCQGYFKQHNGRSMISETRPNNQGVLVGRVSDIVAGGVNISLLKELYRGDVLELGLEDGSVIEITSPSDFPAGGLAGLNAPKSRSIKKGSPVLRTRCSHILDDISKNILGRDNKIVISGVFSALIGERISFTLMREINGETYSATAYGEEAEKAKIGGPDVEKIKQKLSQLGDTDYILEDIRMEVSDDAFVPASHVKRLRREALEMLETEVLSMYRKNRFNYKNRMEKNELEEGADYNEKTGTGTRQEAGGKRTYKLGVATKEQLLALLDAADEGCAAISAVYVGISLYRQIIASPELTSRLKKCGFMLYIETPYVAKDDFDADALGTGLDYVKGIYARNIGGYAAVKKSRLYEMVKNGSLELVIGSGLYAYNREAVGFIGSYLYENPQELSLKELERLYSLPGYRGELLIYGYQPAMISAQCIKGNFYGCSKDKKDAPAAKKITDDKGNVFYSKPYCDECINVVYNGVLYNIIDRLDEIETKISPASYRINFTLEAPEAVEEMLKRCPPDVKHTSGHLYRGVE